MLQHTPPAACRPPPSVAQVGWITGPAPLLAPVIKAHQFLVFTVPSSLQRAVDATYAWCCKWRMKANIGQTKSAVMIFAPGCAPRPLTTGDIVWGGAPLPVVDKYKYLGVMLSADCTWKAHVERVCGGQGYQGQLRYGQCAAQPPVGC